MRSRTAIAAGTVLALTTLVAACGDDDDEASGADNQAFCDIALELEEQEDFPTVEQLAEYRDTAPVEIEEAVGVVVDAFTEATEAGDVFAAFEEPGVEEAFEDVIDPYEQAECGIEREDEGDDDPPADPTVTSLDPAAARVDVAATDYAFEFTPPAAGRTSFVMTNRGEERHVMFLFRLVDGATVDEVLAADGDEGVGEEWESETAAAGEEAVLTADLEPGTYGMICYIPTADGEEHFDLGMQETFVIS